MRPEDVGSVWEIASETIVKAYHDAYERGKAAAREFPKVEVYRWVCPWCAGGTDRDDASSSGCFHCAGFGLTNDVAGWDVADLTPAPEPAALMPAQCGDCAYRTGSPEQQCSTSVTLPGGDPENPGVFFCHVGMKGDNKSGYHATAWVGEYPLGAFLCRGWWNRVTGAPMTERPYRDLRPGPLDLHRCTAACAVCPACGDLRLYQRPSGGRLGEHVCTNVACVFPTIPRPAMKALEARPGPTPNG